jgi:KUP system potassium uptake protein
MISTVIVTAVYNNTISLGNAYGVCVIMVTFFDTFMVTLVALIVWLLPWYVVVFPAITIITLDSIYLSAAITKVPLSAWFTLTLAAVLAIFFII